MDATEPDETKSESENDDGSSFDDEHDDSMTDEPGVDETHHEMREVAVDKKENILVGQKNNEKKKKIGPQKQKKVIHTLLKKAKIYEVRKLTRRIEVLRKLKGTEQQKQKNIRKVEKLLKEIDAMKSFIIDTLTERTVDVFKNTADKQYVEIWEACVEQKKVEALLQIFSNADTTDEKFSKIAYLRMLSSKDIVGKLKLIAEGVNINPKKDKDKSKQANKKNIKNQLNKTKDRNENIEDTSIQVLKNKQNVETNVKKGKKGDINDKAENKSTKLKKLDLKNMRLNDTEDVEACDKSKESESVAVKDNSPKIKKKKKKKRIDTFFLGDAVTLTDDDGDDESDEDGEMDEFSAPVDESKLKNNSTMKKNRMGQRQRKKILDKKQGKYVENRYISTRGGNRGKYPIRTPYPRPNASDRFKAPKGKFVNDKRYGKMDKKEVDKTLHPSWQAKQKQKKNIVAFSGTKITFD